jgi:hypothetical protein
LILVGWSLKHSSKQAKSQCTESVGAKCGLGLVEVERARSMSGSWPAEMGGLASVPPVMAKEKNMDEVGLMRSWYERGEIGVHATPFV